MLRGTFGMPDAAGSQRAALAERISQRSQRASAGGADTYDERHLRHAWWSTAGHVHLCRLGASRGVAELADTDLDCIERLYQSLRARVCPVCVSEDVQKEHSLNVGMMKMEELRRAFILS